MGNLLSTTLVRAGVKMGPIHLLTVRGRKSGKIRTIPVAVVEQQGKRYLIAPFGAMRRLGAIGILDALIIPVLLTQEVVFSGNTYWLVQATYLLIGIDVLALAQIMNTHYKRLKLIASKR